MWDFAQSLRFFTTKKQQKQLLSVFEIRLFFRSFYWVPESEEILIVYSTKGLLQDFRHGIQSYLDQAQYFLKLKETWKHLFTNWVEKHQEIILNTKETRMVYMKVRQTPTTSKHSIEFTYGDFLCHLKVNKDNLAWLINRRWKCQKGKRYAITANF